MKKKVLLFFGLTFAAAIGFCVFFLANDESVGAQTNPTIPHPFAAVNQMALDARNGDIESSRQLVGEIIKVTGFDSELRGFTATSLADRVGRAEISYRSGNSAGIPETKIVRTVNGLVRRFSLPAFVKTDSYEVRKLRLSLLPHFPQIINQKSYNTPPVSVGSQIDSYMSPAEAVFVLSMMIQQKLANPEFQQTYSERIARWSETHSHGSGHNGSASLPPNRSREVRDALRSAVQTVSVTDALQLSAITLNTLGIDQ